MKISLYQPCNDGTYHTIPDNMLVSNPEHFYPAADYEALEAKLAAAEKRVKELGGLVQQHQTYQTKEGIKS